MGIPRGTFRKIVSGETPNPRWDNVQKIQAHYERLPIVLPDHGQHEAPRMPR